ncbi:hypothetical protein QFZ23_004312 [Arthrobacter globiformis]|uniref:hypothetical protein n=1 Tax=Arthrobacter globiformis TaxID=1665 RepID=UPI00278677CC|nr:hypothetical protein [Arthrobacter globiformis]MDQ1060411.1 hypothetical protein [Arthrobacter globiformis]
MTTTTTSSFALPGATREGPVTVSPDSAELERGLWDALWPAVTQTLPVVFDLFRSQATSADSDGSRDSRVAAERDIAQFMTCLQPIMNALIPSLVDIFRDEAGQRASRGEPAEPDSEAIERFWPALLSAAIPIVVDNLPAAIKTVSGFFRGPGMNGDGKEATADVFIADQEVSARFLGPLLQVLVPALSGTLPEIFKLVSGGGRSRDMTLSWNDFTSTHRLFDNDVVEVKDAKDLGDPRSLKVTLELASHKSWWKGIQALDDNGDVIAEIGVDGRAPVSEMTVSADAIRYLVFGKAKMFGVHTWMYRLATAGLGLEGKQITFGWLAD